MPYKVLVLDALQYGEEVEPKTHLGVEVSALLYELYSGFWIPPPPQKCSFVTLNP